MLFKRTCILFFLLCHTTVFYSVSYASSPQAFSSKISAEERARALKTLRILLDEKDTDLLALLSYYKDQAAIAQDDDRRMPSDNSKVASAPTGWMVMENRLKENHIVLSKEEWSWIDTQCMDYTKKEKSHDACRLRYAESKKNHQDDRVECYRHAVAAFPDKLKKEAIEVSQQVPLQHLHRTHVVRKLVGPFSEEELKNTRISLRNDCMLKKNWKHPMEWKEGKMEHKTMDGSK